MSVLDQFFYKAKDIAKVAGDKTSEVFEYSKIKIQVSQINSDIKSLYEQIGNSVYSMVKLGYKNEDIIYSIVSQIDKLVEKKKLLEDKLSTMKNVKTCPYCSIKNKDTSLYCSNCGSKLNYNNVESKCEDSLGGENVGPEVSRDVEDEV